MASMIIETRSVRIALLGSKVGKIILMTARFPTNAREYSESRTAGPLVTG